MTPLDAVKAAVDKLAARVGVSRNHYRWDDRTLHVLVAETMVRITIPKLPNAASPVTVEKIVNSIHPMFSKAVESSKAKKG